MRANFALQLSKNHFVSCLHFTAPAAKTQRRLLDAPDLFRSQLCAIIIVKILGARAPGQEVLSFMTKIDIFSGFLGAGKTTLIKKLIAEAYTGEKIVLIENEFGEIAIDGGFLKDSGVQINEMNSGCICCSLVGDFADALQKVLAQFHPDRILIEPSGVGKLSDVAKAVASVPGCEIGAKVTVVDAGRCRMYIRNFGEFFNDQVHNADVIVLSRTDSAADGKVVTATAMLSQLNPNATVITTPWSELDGKQIVDVMEHIDSLSTTMQEMEHHDHNEHHHDHDHDHDHEHHHDHDHEHDHEHHHDHEHEHGESCSCGCGHDHHHHDADEVFTSWGVETPKKFTEEEVRKALGEFDEDASYGTILRAKGFVDSTDGQWIYFDYVPGEWEVRSRGTDVGGKLVVIGSKLRRCRHRSCVRHRLEDKRAGYQGVVRY